MEITIRGETHELFDPLILRVVRGFLPNHHLPHVLMAQVYSSNCRAVKWQAVRAFDSELEALYLAELVLEGLVEPEEMLDWRSPQDRAAPLAGEHVDTVADIHRKLRIGHRR